MFQAKLQGDPKLAKVFTQKGGMTLIEGVRANIQESSQSFFSMFRGDKNLSNKQIEQLGRVANSIFYDALSSNIVLGSNMIKKSIRDKVNETKVPSTAITGMRSNLDLMYTLDVIPPKYLKDHFGIRERVEASIQKSRNFQNSIDFILSEKPIPSNVKKVEFQAEKEKAQETKEIIRGYRDGLAKDKLFKQIEKGLPKADKRVRKMINDLETIFHARPDILNNLDTVFPAVTARPTATNVGKLEIGIDLKNATTQDVNNFINFFKRPMTDKQWKKWYKGESIDNPLKKADYWRFNETIVDKNAPFDITLVPTKGLVFRGGKIVEVDMKRPMSKVQRLTDNNRVMTERATALTDQFGNYMEREVGYLSSLNTTLAKNIETAAIGKVEIARLDNKELKRRETYEEGKKFYEEFIKTYGKEKNNIIVDGVSKSFTVKQITDMTAKKITKILEEINVNMLQQKDVPFYSKNSEQEFLIYKNGFPSIEATVYQRINRVIESSKDLEMIDNNGYKLSSGLSNDSIMKTLKLAEVYNETVQHKGKDVLRRDLKKLDPKRLRSYLFGSKNKPGILDTIQKSHGIGTIEKGYFPHMGHPRAVIEGYVKEKMVNKGADKDGAMEEMTRAELNYLGRERADGGGMMEFQNFLLNQGYVQPGVKTKSAQNLTPNMKSRSADLPHYLKNVNVLNNYATQAIRLRYNAMMALSNHVTIRNFDKAKNLNGTPLMGNTKNQEHWGRFLRLLSLKDSGGSHVLPEQWLSDKSFPISKAYKHLTEGELYKTAKKAGKFFGNEDLFLAKDLSGKATIEANSARLNHLANLEAKISTSTLLANTRGVTYNITGGSVNTIINAGFDNFRKSFDYKYLRGVIPDPKAKKGKQDTRGRDWFIDWAKKHGVIETFWTNELAGNPNIRSMRIGNVLGGKGGGEIFSKGLYKRLLEAGPLSKNKPKDQKTMTEILKEFGVDAKANELGGWFMKTAEVELRLRGFISHYLKAREVFDSQGKHFKADDPFLIEMALKGVTGTQYLYNNTFRSIKTI